MTEIIADYVDFSLALESLKEDNKIRRITWNDGTYIQLIDPEEQSVATIPIIYSYNWDGTVVPWIPTQSDILAEDWFII